MLETENKKVVYSWALYDWANSAFATSVLAGFFPIFFKQYWSAGADATVSTLRLGTANSLSGIVIVVLAPLLGAIADKGSAKKRFLFFFAVIGVIMTLALFLIREGAWQWAVFVYAAASTGFTGSIVFYDSLIVSVATEDKTDVVSALGYGLGYLGGGLLFAVNVLMVSKPDLFGLDGSSQAIRFSFVTVAVWWALFSIPIYLFVPEPPAGTHRGWRAIAEGFYQLNRTFRELRQLRVVFYFLFAYWLYIDGVQTIARMAVDYGLSLGFPAQSLITALLITQIVGFPAAIAFGKLGERFGAKAGIYIGIAGYCIICIWAYFMSRIADVYILAISIGLLQGGVQSLSRSFYARIIPRSKAGEFFGFYNMLGKFAAVIGPILMGWVAVATGSSRASMISVIILFAAGLVFLGRANEAEGRRMAAELDASL